ncbi:MAG: 4Fe-4S binding protein [Desulfobacterales bacterium]|nr:4Fe-4S binding protein [Desulfobacterales bacterium]
MSDLIYEELRKLLDRHPTGCPSSPEIIEILKLLFSCEEAKIATNLTFRPIPLPSIAKKMNIENNEAFKHLESLANKGVVFAKKKDGEWNYALLPIMPGLFEFPYMKPESNKNLDKLRDLWKVYLKVASREFGSKSTSFSRIIPIQESIESKPGVLTYEKVYEMIEKSQVLGIAKCACREVEQKCESPRESCMLFDDTCTYLVERGFGRYITKEEMKEKLKEFDKFGLVHQINNAQDRLTFICNCCPCCCGLLRAYTIEKNPHVVMFSSFIPKCDETSCTGCGICANERCPMAAIEMKDNMPIFNDKLCIGCGLCVTGCKENAIELIRRQDIKEVAASTRDMGLKVLQDKGKLEGFLPLIMPSA